MTDPSPQPVATSTGEILDAAAISMARAWKLVRADGTVKCLRDACDGDATLPTLECLACRDRRLGA